jgi:hypothetical protein
MKRVTRLHPDNCSQHVVFPVMRSVKWNKVKLRKKSRCASTNCGRSNLTCVTVITRVFESFLQLQLYCRSSTIEFSSGTKQVAVTEATVPGAIGRPTDDTGLVAPNKPTQNSRPPGDYAVDGLREGGDVVRWAMRRCPT